MYGVEPFGSVPYGYVKDAGVASKLQQAALASSGHIYIVEITAKEIGATDETVFRYSTTGYVSPNLTGHPNDNVYFDGRVTSPFQISRTIPVAPESSRRIVDNLGTIELVNTDGEFDTTLQTYAVDGRKIRVLFGLDSYAYRDFTLLFSGSIIDWKTDLSTLTIAVRDNSYKLDRPLQTNLYGGTGGADGTVQIANTPKPICLQTVTNETPVFVDPSNLVWQINDGAINSVTGIRDKGSELAFTADYSTYSALTAASLSTGQYATSLSLGFVRLGGTPAGAVTFDAVGSVYSSSSANPSVDVAFSLLKKFGVVDDAAINIERWLALESDVEFAPGTGAGKFFSNAPINISDALDDYMASIFWYWGCDLDGRLSCGTLKAADSSAIGAVLGEDDVRDIEIVDAPDGTSPPRWLQKVAYNRNGTVQSPNDLAAGVTAANIQKYNNPYFLYIKSDTSVQADFITAFDPPVLVSPYVQPTDAGEYPAQTVADRIQTYFGVQNTLIRCDVGTAALTIEIGTTVLITHPRINGGAQWSARVVDVDVDAAIAKYDIYLFGEFAS